MLPEKVIGCGQAPVQLLGFLSVTPTTWKPPEDLLPGLGLLPTLPLEHALKPASYP